MRRESTSAEMDLPEVAAAEAGATEPAAGATPEVTSETPAIAAAKAGGLAALMALSEPARTASLEAAVAAGETFILRSKNGEEVRVRYGRYILTVPVKPKPFIAAHAIHLLWTVPALVEEVEE